MSKKNTHSSFRAAFIDQAPLVGSTVETKHLREVELLDDKADQFGYRYMRPIGSTPIHIHERWIRPAPRG